MITSTAPAMLAILSVVFLKEGLSTPVILGILLCVFGIVLINIGDLLASQNPIELSGNVIGNSLILMAVIGESFFSILRKKLSFKGRPFTCTTYIIGFSTLMFMPLGFIELKSIGTLSFGIGPWLAISYYGLFCTVLAYVCWFMGIAKVKASVAAGFTGFMPISSTLLSFIFLGEVLMPLAILGGITTLLGICVVSIDFTYVFRYDLFRTNNKPIAKR